MRDLTSEELKKWPHWATHYRVDETRILFESKDRWMEVGTKFPFITRGPFKQKSKLTKCKKKPVIKKPFSIMEHRFSDTYLIPDSANDESIVLEIENCDCVTFKKRDIIAMAKQVSLTAEDLK